jgi:predicted GH43/DUF377 family glycosyl hydrolase
MKVHPTGILLRPDNKRVVVRPFIPINPARVEHIISRALSLSERETEQQLSFVRGDFSERHIDLSKSWLRNFEKVRGNVPDSKRISEARRLFIGALFSGEYALESAALFNPSIVPHPDQTGVSQGDLRFILSLRSTGEGHVSSIQFRAGVIHRDYSIEIDKPTPFVTLPELNPNPTYHKRAFLEKLREMGLENDWATSVMSRLGNTFLLDELDNSIQLAAADEASAPTRDVPRTLECMHWLAESNYEIHFAPSSEMSERIIFPVSPNESNGIEDARFVRFVEDDGNVTYYATYTAYNGRVILPQLIETEDFVNFRALTLNGQAVQNKGMALFPHRIDGRYVMLTRHDDENLYLAFSDNPHFWSDPLLLEEPQQPWEFVKLGNCGSPIETEAGWLVLIHGVGPMRKYCIGATLLDLHDPATIIGQLKEPLLSPQGNEREGYVPNVVYSCGSLIYNGRLILPYGVSDTASSIVTVELTELLAALT